MSLGLEQEVALGEIRSGKNLIITGGGGVGKSYLIRKIVDESTVLVAPTGIAALNIGGSTCHRTFGLPLGIPVAEDYLKTTRRMQELFDVRGPVKRLVIDEISMLRTDMFELINSKLQMIRGNNKPFGGIQFIGFGDYFQLDPIVSKYDEIPFYEKWESPFNFTSEYYDFNVVELTQVFRQSDARQISMLDEIRRKGKNYKYALDTIIAESKPYESNPDTTHICCYKKDVKKYNFKYFRKLNTPIVEFHAKITGDDDWSDSNVAHTVKLREGCRVMFKANDPDDHYVNGEKGVVTHVDEYNIRVRKQNGVEVAVEPFEWDKFRYVKSGGSVEKEVFSTFSQIPLDLSYAQSIHSSQGITVDDCTIDVGDGCFSHGQLYVALSRCTDLRNISFVRDPQYSDVICHKDVKAFYRNLTTV